MGGVRHSGASHPLIIVLLSPLLRPPAPPHPSFLHMMRNFAMLCCIRTRTVPRFRSITDIMTDWEERKTHHLSPPPGSFPFMTCHSCPSPISPPCPPGSVKQFKFLYFTTSRRCRTLFSLSASVTVRPTFITAQRGSSATLAGGC